MYRFFKIFIYVLTINASKFDTQLPKTDSTDQVIDKILELRPSKISIFSSGNYENKILTQHNLILEEIICKIPTFIVTANDKDISNSSFEIESMYSSIYSDLNVIIQYSDNFDVQKIKTILNFIAMFSFKSPRPKCLFVLFSDYKSNHNNIQELFKYAWKLKFFDFSILIVPDNGNPVIRNYNPFNKSYSRSRELFPDKLKNMNGHKIKTLLFNRLPHIEFVNNSNKFSLNGILQGFWNLATTVLNFEFDFVKISNVTIPDSYVFKKIESGEIDTSIITHILGTQLASHYRKGLLFGKVVKEANMHLVVPIFHTNHSSRFDFKILAYSLVTVLIILATIIVVKLCKFSSLLWTPFYVFALLFGVTVNKKPKKLLEKLVFINFAVWSIHYSGEIFVVFINDDVVRNDEIMYDALEEVKNPSLTLYVGNTLFSDKTFDDDEIISNIKEHSKRIDKTDECYEWLASWKNCFCLNSELYARHMIKKYLNLDKSPRMKVARPVILGDFFVHLYAKNSPYRSKFDQVFQRILESGLQNSAHHGKKYLKSYESKKQNFSFKSNNNIKNQLVIFMIGCGLSVFAFILEIVYFQVKVKSYF